jgi:Spy/CpxP family protein refolding chaperone
VSRRLLALQWVAAALVGATLGVAADRALAARRPPAWPPRAGAMLPTPEMRARGRARIARALDLTDDQRRVFDSVMTDLDGLMDSLRRASHPGVDSAMRASKAALDAILTPAQRARRDAWARDGAPPPLAPPAREP